MNLYLTIKMLANFYFLDEFNFSKSYLKQMRKQVSTEDTIRDTYEQT